VAFLPDGKRLVTTGYDHQARILDAENGREILTLRGHTAEVFTAAVTRDGRTITTGGFDGTARVWPAFPWRPEEYPGAPGQPLQERIWLYKKRYHEELIGEIEAPEPIGHARRIFRADPFVPGAPIPVRLEVRARPGGPPLSINENVPPGWRIAGVSHGGRAIAPRIVFLAREDPHGGAIHQRLGAPRIQWQIPSWTSPVLSLEYTVIPPADADWGPAVFEGAVVCSGGCRWRRIDDTVLTREGARVIQEGLLPHAGYEGVQDAQRKPGLRDSNRGEFSRGC